MSSTLIALKGRKSQTALINQRGEKISFEDYYDYITKVSFELKERGLNPESKVLVLAPLDWPLYCLIASCFQLGASIVLIDPWADSLYIEKALGQVNPEFLVMSKKARFFLFKKAIRKIPNKINLEDLISSKTKNRLTKVTEVTDDHTALITFTSGTTGIPKGFDRSHKFLLEQQNAHEKYFDHSPTDIDLSMYPVFILSNLKTGLTSVLIKGNLRKIDTINPKDLYEQIIHYCVNTISLSPVIMEKLLVYCEENNLKLNLRTLFTGGAPVHPQLCERILTSGLAQSGYVVYGSTEAEPISLVPMKEVKTDSESIKLGTPLGKIVPSLFSKIHPIQNTHPYHKGRIGELSLTGDFVGKKYWNNEKAFKENKWIDEENRIWHNTGDVVTFFEDNYYMLGRKNNGIQTNNGLLYPVPVENQIDLISGVKKSSYLEFNNKILLVYEGIQDSQKAIKDFFTDNNLPLDKIIRVSEIPRDARHRTKIDLPKLKDNLMTAVSKDSPLASRLLAYTKERFPLIPISIFVFLLTAGHAHFFSSWFSQHFQWNELQLWQTMICIFLFMLQLRMADEIKDFHKDSIAYPMRILSQGIIPLSVIRNILYLTIGLELVLSFSMGLPHGIWMIVLQTWAFLMAKEFFAPKVLEASGLLNLVLHQLILFPLAIFAALPFIAYKVNLFDTELLAPLLFLTLHYTLYEISRKTWSADRESEHADSYTRFWGIKGAIGSQIFLLILNFALLNRLDLVFSTAYNILACLLGVIYVLTLVLFLKNQTKKNSKLVELGGSIFLLGMCALNAFLLS